MATTYIVDKDGNSIDASSATVPSDRHFRGAWSLSGKVISEDMTKAKEIFKDKIREVRQPYGAGLPYSKLTYENYGELNGYTLPRKITILSADGNSKVVFQIRSLQLNPKTVDLRLDIPSNIIIDRL